MPIKAVIFDFFGVIGSSAVMDWLRINAGPGISQAELDELFDKGDVGRITSRELWLKLAEISGMTAEEAQAAMSQEVKLNFAVLKLLDRLSKNYKTALLSNADHVWLSRFLEQHSLINSFDVIVMSSRVRLVKPQRQIYELTLKELGVVPAEAVFIDDIPAYVHAAQQLGIAGIHFTDAPALEKSLTELGLL